MQKADSGGKQTAASHNGSDAGKIGNNALVSEGRSARITVRLAVAQPSRSIGIDQRVGDGLKNQARYPPGASAVRRRRWP